jgi:hypothetical protein
MVNYTSPAKTAISDTRPAESDGKVWVDTSQDPPKMKLYDAATQAFIPASAKSTIVSQTKPTPEVGKIWFEPVQDGANMYAASSFRWEFLNFLSATPDTSMFQSPLYQWYAGAGFDVPGDQEVTSWEGQLASLTASDVGNPLYRADQAGFEAVEYDGTDDAHDVPSDGQLPTGGSPVSFAATLYAKSTSNQVVFAYGKGSPGRTAELRLGSDGSVGVETWFGTIRARTASTYPTDGWITVGGKISDGGGAAFLNGGNKATDTGSMDQPDQNRGIGYRAWTQGIYADYYLYDLVVSDAYESDQAFADYHNERLGRNGG